MWYNMSIFMFFAVLMSFWMVWQSRLNFFLKRETSSPFECGFDPKDSARLPFSLRFFCILILFLMFDVELVLILQMPVMGGFSMDSFLYLVFFFLFLLLGLLEEWRRGYLDWK